MAKYFNYFPKTAYTLDNKSTGIESITKITSRFSFEEKLKENSAAFYKYSIKDSDTPEIIASKYYGGSERHWIVLMFNDIVDPQFDWPLEGRTLIEYIDKKYEPNIANTEFTSGLSWSKSLSNIHSYYKVVTRTSSVDGTITVENLQVDSNTYQNIPDNTTIYTLENNTTITEEISKISKTYYDYEIEENEKKRNIKLLKSDFVDIVEKEFKKIIR
jgi:hypothetical protein